MLSFFAVDNLMFTVWGYPVSWIEFVGVLAGFASVYFAVRENILTWYVGLLNVMCFAILFFQIQLYADFLLQIFYFAISIQGIFLWQKSKANSNVFLIKQLQKKEQIRYFLLWTALVLLFVSFGYFMPRVFAGFAVKPATFLFIDSLLSAASIIATILMAKKKIEAWILWVIIDSCSVFLYLQKETYFVALQFFVFALMAISGYWQWKNTMQKEL